MTTKAKPKKATVTSLTFEDGQRAERERVAEIQSTYQMINRRGAQYDALKDRAITDGWSEENYRSQLKTLIDTEAETQTASGAFGPDTQMRTLHPGMPHITGGDDHRSEWTDAITDSLLIRGGVPVEDPHPERATSDSHKQAKPYRRLPTCMIRPRRPEPGRSSRPKYCERSACRQLPDYSTMHKRTTPR